MKEKVKKSDFYLSKLLTFIKDYNDKYGYSPNIREMADGIGIKSTSTIHYYLKKLENQGILHRDPNKNRAIKYENYCIDGTLPAYMLPMPLLGDIVAGYPLLSEENVMENYAISKNIFGTSQPIFCLKIKGESMIDAGMSNGDLAVVKVQNTAENGDIVVARTEQGTTVKKFYRESNNIRLQPQNMTFVPIIVKDVEILGKVIGVIKRFK